VVFARLDANANKQDIWIADTRGATWRFTSDQMLDASAQWSPTEERFTSVQRDEVFQTSIASPPGAVEKKSSSTAFQLNQSRLSVAVS